MSHKRFKFQLIFFSLPTIEDIETAPMIEYLFTLTQTHNDKHITH